MKQMDLTETTYCGAFTEIPIVLNNITESLKQKKFYNLTPMDPVTHEKATAPNSSV